MNSELDRIFEQGLSEVTRSPRVPLSDEQIAAAAKESKSGAVLWMRMHAKEILLCAVLLSVGIAGTLLVTHFTGNKGSAPEPAEAVAAVVCDTTMVENDADAPSAEPNVAIVEAHHGTSLQNDQSVTKSAKPNTKPAAFTIETQRTASLHNDQPVNTSTKHDTESAAFPVIVKKTIVQRDTVIINETVIINDTVYLMDN